MKIFCIIFLLFNSYQALSQDLGYATIGAIDHNVLIVDKLNDHNKSIRVNEKVAVIQMEGAEPRTSATDTLKRVTTSSQVARKFVVVTVTEIETTDGLITSIKISRNLQTSFAINNNASVHLVPIGVKWNW